MTTVPNTSPKRILIDKAMEYLQAHYTEKFSLQRLADALFVNKHYLARTFREITGTTPLHYHNQLRCECAEELLLHSDYPISVIAFKSGFTSASHFTRIFRYYKNCSPSEFRKSRS